MTIDAIVSAIFTHLQAVSLPARTRPAMATDLWHAYQLLCTGPQGYTVIVQWPGDDAEGDEDQEPLAKHELAVFVGYNLGLNVVPALALIEGTAGRPALLRLVNDVRASLLGLRFPDEQTSRFLEYGGTREVVMPGGIPLAAYKITVRLTAPVDVGEETEVVVE